jgi:adenosylhomocysteine nucleosidase
MRILVAALGLLLALAAPAWAADRLDLAPRVAVISAYEPEWKVLKASVGEARSHEANGVEFVTGMLAGRNVVLFLSGVGMVNAAMTTQLALDRFDVTAIVVSGVAGGVDPGLHIGDVVVAERWGQYLDSVFARETDGKFQPPAWTKTPYPNFGMIFPNAPEVGGR